jgi:SAM-dependent methyltransferase
MFDRLLTSLSKRWFALMERWSLEPRRITSPDRAILEKIILPYFGRHAAFRRVLFVGCSAYTQWYDAFFPYQEYWTIDPQAIKRKYGASRHIVGSVTDLEQHFPAAYFQTIIMNGVIGFGLDAVADIERALDACFEVLDHGGVLVLGWNDHGWRLPVALDALRSLQRFAAYRFEPLQTARLRTAGWHGHTFSFYRKT